MQMFKVFGDLQLKIMFGFMKDIRGVTKKVVWNIVFFRTNENFSEQEFKNFNRDEVGKFSNKEPLGSDNNGEEEG